MILLIDLGNSRCKWALVASDSTKPNWFETGVWNNANFSEAHWHDCLKNVGSKIATKAKKKLEEIYISSVSSDAIQQQVGRYCEQAFQVTPTFLVSGKKYKSLDKNARTLRNSYDKPAALGIDRWLVMVAAIELFDDGFAVIDAGTAITLDCVDSSGKHLGGHIVPGARLMGASLFKNTGKIAFGAELDATTAEDSQWLGVNSQQAVTLGCEAAAVGYLGRILSDLAQKSTIRDFIVCGGDGAALVEQCDPLDFNIHIIDDLVLQGLFYSMKNNT